jgi:ABC-type glycerol-3-phosphate transport system substrate-binding protein
MKRMRILTAAALAATAALLITSCSGAPGNAGDDVKPAKKGSVTWWGWTPDTPVAERYITAFNKQYPDIKVTYKNFENVDYRNTITPALDSGKGPDVFDLSPAGGSPDLWGPNALDLTSLAKSTLGAGWKDKIGGNYVKQLTSSDGRFVSLPLGGMSAGFLWYNKDILDRAGAKVPTDYPSWVDTCKKVTAIGKTCFTMGAGGSDTFPTDMYHSIANSVDPGWFIKASTGKAKWNDNTGMKVLEIIKKMKDDGIIPANALDAPQYPLANNEFMKGDAAMVQMGFWYTQYAGTDSCKAAMQAAGVNNPKCFVQLPAAFPDVAGAGHGSPYFGEADYGIAINSESKNVGAAKTFVSWMTLKKTGQQNVANAIDLLPALKGVSPDWNSIKLVDQATQRPAIEKLIKDSGDTSESRQWQATEKSLDAIVVATQQVLDPSVKKSIRDIANAQQASSVASKVGAK